MKISILNGIVLTIYNLILGIPMFTIQKTTLITPKNILMFVATALKSILGLTTLQANKLIKTNFENLKIHLILAFTIQNLFLYSIWNKLLCFKISAFVNWKILILVETIIDLFSKITFRSPCCFCTPEPCLSAYSYLKTYLSNTSVLCKCKDALEGPAK